jgi:hypothetical protein
MAGQALEPKYDEDGNTDYVFQPEAIGCWVEINNISVYLVRTNEGVFVDLYPIGKENGEPLTSTYASFAEAEAEINNED